MKVGLALAVRFHPDKPYPLTDVYADFLEDCVLAEELGFDFAWFGEHHFTPCRWTPSPLVCCAAVAARTTRLRIGTQVLCLPFHDPLRVAEDVAVLDNISGGRFDFGIGVGSQFEEYRTWKVDPKERHGRTWESIDLILRCYAEEETFSHHGKYYDFPDITFTTKPVQNPMPVWTSAMGPKNLQRTVDRGFHLMAFPQPAYDEGLRAAGRDPDAHFTAPMRQVCLADDTEQAWAAAIDAVHYFINFYTLRRDLEGKLPPPEAEITREMIRNGDAGFWNPVVGTPDDVRAHFEAMSRGEQGRITHLPIGFRHAGMKTEDVHRSMRMFAQEFLPLLRETELTAAAPAA